MKEGPLRISGTIDGTNQLTKAAESRAYWRKNQPGQLASFKILVFGQRHALDNPASAQDVGEMTVQIDKRFVRQ